VATRIDFTLDGRRYPLTYFALDEDGRVESTTEYCPEPYEPPPGREHPVER
jgi:hypothetical protein